MDSLEEPESLELLMKASKAFQRNIIARGWFLLLDSESD